MNFASASTNKRDTRMFLASEGRVAFLPHPGGNVSPTGRFANRLVDCKFRRVTLA